jgi:malate dehydrogenase
MTWCQVNGYHADKLDEALDGVKVVVIPAGVPRKVRLCLCVKCVP